MLFTVASVISVGLKILDSKRRMSPLCRIMASLNHKLKLSSGHLGFSLILNQKSKKGDKVLAEIIDTNYEEELKAGKEDCI